MLESYGGMPWVDFAIPSCAMVGPRCRRKLTFGVQALEVVDRELQDLRLLQLGRALLLEGRGHETPQLAQGRVDPVPTPLLDDASAFLAAQQLAAVGVSGRRASARRNSDVSLASDSRSAESVTVASRLLNGKAPALAPRGRGGGEGNRKPTRTGGGKRLLIFARTGTD